MATDFLNAAERHLADARLLDREKRYANADHLYGVAAECMLKAIMVSLGAPTSRKGNLHERAHKTHIDELWSEFCAFAGGAGGASYLPFPPNYRPFPDWDINQRYAPQAGFTDGWLRSNRRREDMHAIVSSLQAAILDGIFHVGQEDR